MRQENEEDPLGQKATRDGSRSMSEDSCHDLYRCLNIKNRWPK